MSSTPDPNATTEQIKQDIVETAAKAGVSALDKLLTTGSGSRDWNGRPIKK